jgi:hypothetical protein
MSVLPTSEDCDVIPFSAVVIELPVNSDYTEGSYNWKPDLRWWIRWRAADVPTFR